MPTRPLSPHLSVYKFKYTLATSILNRLTGVLLSGGLVLLIAWLGALASGPRSYAHLRAVLPPGLLKVLALALLAGLSYHLLAGIRHLLWDTGHYLEREQSRRSAWLVVGMSLALLAVLAYLALCPSAGRP